MSAFASDDPHGSLGVEEAGAGPDHVQRTRSSVRMTNA